MTDDLRLERLLRDVLAAGAPTREPETLVPRVLAATSRTWRRPRWLALSREPAMRRDKRIIVGSPGLRAAYVVVVSLLVAVLAVGGILAAAALLREAPPIPPERSVLTPTAGPTGSPTASRLGTEIPRDPGTFSSTGSLNRRRESHTTTRLADDSVLVIGGVGSEGVAFTSTEQWDPLTGSFNIAGTLSQGRSGHTATLLLDGRVLVIGGNRSSAPVAEIWDPETRAFRATGPLEAFGGHTATLLSDGRVLVIGGQSNDLVPAIGTSSESFRTLASAQIWDPSTETFGPAGSLAQARYGHTATLLPDGRVLVVGGSTFDISGLALAEVWNPDTKSFSAAGSLAASRSGHTASLLPNGRVLIAGGSNNQLGPLATTEIWDPRTLSFTPAGALAQARYEPTSTVLRDGRIVIVGGYVPIRNRFVCTNFCLASAEIFDVREMAFRATGSMAEGRVNHTATLLADGRVLIVGGGLMDEAIGSSELYQP